MKITKYSVWLLVVILLLPGCAAAKKKFVRKKQRDTIQPQIYTQKEFVKPYSNSYYYASHFNLWKVWHEDLLKLIDGNQKRRRMASDEVMQHLNEMIEYLNEEKSSELLELSKEVEQAIGILDSGGSTNESRARFMLERTLRVIRAQFAPSDVSDQIKSDVLDI